MERVSEEYIELISPNSLELEATVDGAYTSVKWYRGGVELTPGGNVTITDFNQKLTLTSTSESDAVQYEVIATNDTANVSVTFEVQVFSEYIHNRPVSGVATMECVE